MQADVVLGRRLRVYGFASAHALGGRLVGRLKVGSGEVFRIELSDAPAGPIRWSADNDEVLDIEDDGGTKATITAATPGKSDLDIVQRGRVICTVLIEVVPAPAARLVPVVGSVQQK